jgi:hypothetical protein
MPRAKRVGASPQDDKSSLSAAASAANAPVILSLRRIRLLKRPGKRIRRARASPHDDKQMAISIFER